MPTPALLDRELARAAAAESWGEIQDTFRNMVDVGVDLLARANQTVSGPAMQPRDFHVGILLLLRHLVEQLDAIDELFRAGCFHPARLQGRAIVETRVQMLYMAGRRAGYMESPLHPQGQPVAFLDPVPRDPASGRPLSGAALEAVQDRRARAYLVGDLRRQLELVNSLEASRAAELQMQRTGMASVPEEVTAPEIQEAVKRNQTVIEARLRDPDNDAVDQEFTRTRGRRPHDPSWYTLDDGPKSVRTLAGSVGDLYAYEIFYAEASLTMHGSDVQGQLTKGAAGEQQGLARLRAADDLSGLVVTILSQVAFAYELVILLIRPDEHENWKEWVRRWYSTVEGAFA